jgi:acyl CoA:acetate/3-ketoacid CoA transferase beta subunit
MVDGEPRAKTGLSGLGTASIVTDRAVIDVEDDGLRLRSVHPGEDAAAVVADTPVALASDGVVEAQPPSPGELRLIREEFDTQGWYTT